MSRKFQACAMMLVLIAMSTFNVIRFSVPANAQSIPNIYIDPQLTNAGLNSTFSVKLNLTNGKDVCSWQAYIYYKNDVLEAVSYFEGPFLSSHGSTLFDGSFDNQYNATYGQLWMWCIRTWSGYGVDGSGMLAIVSFRAKGGGTSPISLANTILGNSSAQGQDHTNTDGSVQVAKHDVAVISMACKTVVGRGYPVNINVNVTNLGDFTEAFNVTASANGTIVTALRTNVTVPSGSYANAALAWNTTGTSYGDTYVVTAYAWPVPGETNMANNNSTASNVVVSIPGDLNGDFKVALADLVILALAYGARPGDVKWNLNADIDCNGVVGLSDLVIMANHYGQHYP